MTHLPNTPATIGAAEDPFEPLLRRARKARRYALATLTLCVACLAIAIGVYEHAPPPRARAPEAVSDGVKGAFALSQLPPFARARVHAGHDVDEVTAVYKRLMRGCQCGFCYSRVPGELRRHFAGR